MAPQIGSGDTVVLFTSQSATPALLSKLAFETFKLGPVTLSYMAYKGASYMFSGIVPNGARQTIAAVDSERQATIAQIVATMVKLGYANLVAAMTSEIVRGDRADVVAKVSIQIMLAGELDALTQITQKMIERGETTEAATICRAMGDHGHQEFLVMIATENLPEPIQKAKEHVDSAIAWVTGKDKEDVGQELAEKAADKAEEVKEATDVDEEEGESESKSESKSAPSKLTEASIT